MKVKIKKSPRKTAKNGAFLEQLTSDIMLAHGPSHSNGGIEYNGVEIEGGEPIYTHPTGDQTVFGNSFLPGTKMKFKQAAKNIAKKEQKVDKLMQKGAELVNSYDWKDKWDELKFNAGSAMLQGAILKQRELAQNKEHLANLQQALLETADEMGADPFQLSKGKIAKAKNGMKLTDDDPKKKKKDSMAVRMNNPGNIKFGAFAKKYGAVQGDPATDGGYFAKFPDSDSGMKALKGLLKTNNYKNLSVDAAIKRWTNGSGYSVNYKDIKDKTVGQLSEQEFQKLVDTITVGEDGKYYTPGSADKSTSTPINKSYIPDYISPVLKNFIPGVPKEKQIPRTVKGDDAPLDVTQPAKLNIPSNAKGLDWYQIAPELAAFAQNKVEPVWMQQFDPQLFQQTRVSFQDRLNDNNTSFNSLSRILQDNPAALAALAGQKYSADNSIRGEEFRTNQQIEQDVVNKNISLLNDAQLKNLQLADTQYVRQSQARSNTKALNNTILNSITGKIAQNEARNQALKYYETMTGYRFDPKTGQLINYNGNGADLINIDGSGTPVNNRQNSTKKEVYDNNQNLKSVTYTTPADIDLSIKAGKSQLQQQQLQNMKLFGISKKKSYPFIQENGGSISKFFNSYKKK